MSNRNFNKQTTNARQGFASGSMVRPLDNIRSKGDKMKKYLIGSKKKSDMRKKYAPDFKEKATLLPKSKDSNLTDKMKKMERPKPTRRKRGKATDRLKKINSGNSKFSRQPI
tara:strand:+ start:50 stop:385 length:336 start_codon:yes stop_codon:yes gene_type:complete